MSKTYYDDGVFKVYVNEDAEVEIECTEPYDDDAVTYHHTLSMEDLSNLLNLCMEEEHR